MTRKSFNILLPVLMVCCMLTGCQSNKTPKSIKQEDVLLAKAVKSLKSKRYSSAIDPLRSLNQDYVTSPNAQTYRLELMHAEFRAGEYENAASTANQFITMYPHEKNVDYVLYMRGLSLYKSYNDWMPKRFKTMMGGRDPQPLNEAISSLEILMTRFPTSPYFYQASQLLIDIRETIAERHYTIAESYFSRLANVASLERLKMVLENTQSDAMLYKTLVMMEKNYKKLGMDDMKHNIADIIRLNWSK